MAMSDKIQARANAILARASEQLPECAEVFADELRVVLNVQGTPESPSLPGQAPRRQSGRMWKSIVVVPDERAGVVYVGPTVPYAKFLLPSRPFYRIAADNVRQKMRDILFDDVKKAAGKPAGAGRRSVGSRIASFFGRR